MPNYRHIFGPVQSRRLGVSLGVDCVTAKTCNLDCIYCECGATTNCTMDRVEYVPASEIIAELRDYLSSKPHLDYITFGGSGEPTLNSGLGAMLRTVKKEFPDYKTALLTNGTLLYMPEVREAILPFDCILPSLDAVSEQTFTAINRHHSGISLSRMIDGLIEFSKLYRGVMLVEVFIVPGINDTPNELARFKDILTQVKPTRVQLNSLDRPGTVRDLKPASPERLAEIAHALLPLPVEIISRNAPVSAPALKFISLTVNFIDTLRRRPLTVEETAVQMGLTINDAKIVLDKLYKEEKVTFEMVEGGIFYKAN
jgi:wyosine [tRNA(Phe)-imidazoG37] synthetase (radical SAM superfamily)